MASIISRLLAKSAKELQDNIAMIPGPNDKLQALVSTIFAEAETKIDVILEHSNGLCPRFTGFDKLMLTQLQTREGKRCLICALPWSP